MIMLLIRMNLNIRNKRIKLPQVDPLLKPTYITSAHAHIKARPQAHLHLINFCRGPPRNFRQYKPCNNNRNRPRCGEEKSSLDTPLGGAVDHEWCAEAEHYGNEVAERESPTSGTCAQALSRDFGSVGVADRAGAGSGECGEAGAEDLGEVC